MGFKHLVRKSSRLAFFEASIRYGVLPVPSGVQLNQYEIH